LPHGVFCLRDGGLERPPRRAAVASLVTADVDHMIRVPGLLVEDWS
jgi:hypothetical protein